MSKEKYNGETTLATLIQKIRAALNSRVSTSTTINGKSLSSNIILTAEDIGGASIETMTGDELQTIWDENIAGTEDSQTLTDIVTAHINNENNPHNVTAADVGIKIETGTITLTGLAGWTGATGTVTFNEPFLHIPHVSIYPSQVMMISITNLTNTGFTLGCGSNQTPSSLVVNWSAIGY